jgi:IclR family transcriptional regulator, pca regulon regulatory protein
MSMAEADPIDRAADGTARRDLVGGFLKGLRVIEAFSAEHPRQSIADLSRTTLLDRASCRRLLLTLVHAGYADHDGRHFWLTPRALRLSHVYLDSASLPNILQPYLEQISAELHESCSASVLDGDEVLYVARASYQRVMSINLRVGSVVPVHCSSMGRVLLAGLPREEARRRLERTERTAFTPATVTDVEALLAAIDLVRTQGYALLDQELEIGLRSIAVPVLDGRGQALAAINIGANASRVSVERLVDSYLPRLLAAQHEIARIL